MLFIIIFMLSIVSGVINSMDHKEDPRNQTVNDKKKKVNTIVNTINGIPKWLLEDQIIAGTVNPNIFTREQRSFLINELSKFGLTIIAIKNPCLLHSAAYYNNPKLINLLILNLQAVVDHVDYWQRTPLMYAADHSNFDAVQVLLEHQANAELADKSDETVLFHALTSTKRNSYYSKRLQLYMKVIDLLLKYLNGQNINTKFTTNADPLVPLVPLDLYIKNLEDAYSNMIANPPVIFYEPTMQISERLERLKVLLTLENMVEKFIQLGADMFIGGILSRAGNYDNMRMRAAISEDVANYIPLTDRIMKWDLHQIKKIFSRWPNLLFLIISYLNPMHFVTTK